MKVSTRIPTEHQEQAAFFQWWGMWSKKLPFMAFAIPNGGARNAVTGATLKREGVKAGIPDVMVAWPRNGKAGLFLEFKRQKGGSVSPEQQLAMENLDRAGYECHVVKGWAQARDVVKEYATRGA